MHLLRYYWFICAALIAGGMILFACLIVAAAVLIVGLALIGAFVAVAGAGVLYFSYSSLTALSAIVISSLLILALGIVSWALAVRCAHGVRQPAR